MIIKVKGGWEVRSGDGTKRLGGPYPTRKQAEERLAQVERMKNMSADELKTVSLKGVPIFKAGTWTPANAPPQTYSVDQLKGMVSVFNETKERLRPYLKISHKEKSRYSDSPAFGWLNNLYLKGDTLVADFARVPATLFKLIKAGAFPRVSSELLKNARIGDTVRPWAVKAVALLGAEHPAVDSLDAIAKLYQAPDSDSAEATLWVGPGEAGDDLELGLAFAYASSQEEEPLSQGAPHNHGGDDMDKVQELEQQLAAEKAGREAAERAQAESDAKYAKALEEQRTAEIKAKAGDGMRAVDEAIKAGRLAPVSKPYMEAIVNQLAEHGTVVSFAAAEGDTPKDVGSMALFTEMLGKLPTVVEYSEQAQATSDTDGEDGKKPASVVAHEKALKHQAEHQGVTYEQALDFVLGSDPKLREAYGKPAAM